MAYHISVLEYIGVSVSIKVSAGFFFWWQVLPFREWNRLKTCNRIVFKFLNTENYILFKISVWGLFLEYS